MRTDQAPFDKKEIASGARAGREPARPGPGSDERSGRSSATTHRSRRSIPPPTHRSRSARRTWRGQAAADHRGRAEWVRRHALRVERLRDARTRPADPAGREGDQDQHQAADRRRRRHATTASTGWTRRWGSRTTGTAACRTWCCRRRSCRHGTWNAAHFNNSQYDSLVKTYVAALDLDAQRTAAGQIETLLLDETPIAFFYFYNHMTATKPAIVGVETTGMGHIRLTKTAFLSS